MYRPTSCYWLALLTGLLVAPALAADPVTLKVRQAHVRLPDLTAYLAIDDQNGDPITAVTPQQLSATVGPHAASVGRVQPFADSREGIAYIFLVDISKSLREAQFAPIREALADWAASLREQDRGALITFGSEVRVVQDFTADKTALKDKIASLRPTDQHTRLHQGLTRAIELGRRQDPGLPKRRVIVTLSDGLDDIAGGMTREEVLAAMAVDPVPIYAIGFFSPPKTPKKEDGLKALGEFTRRSGGVYQDGSTAPLADSYRALRQRVDQVLIAHLTCPACQADGRQYRLQIDLQAGNRRLSDGIELRLLPDATAATPPPSPPPAQPPVVERPAPLPLPPWWRQYAWLIALAVLALVLTVVGLVIVNKRKRQQAVAEAAEPAPYETFAHTSTWETAAPSPPPSLAEPTPPLPPAGMAITLTSIGRGPTRLYHLNLVERIVIGRRPDCDLALVDDDMVSSTHCALIREGERVYIQDLGSTNGTVVNGVPIKGSYLLQPEDRILLGQTDLRITF